MSEPDAETRKARKRSAKIADARAQASDSPPENDRDARREIARNDREFTEEKRKVFFQKLAQGADIETACALAGCSTATVYRWEKAGKAARKGPFFEFAAAFTKAKAGAIGNALIGFHKAAKNDPKSYAWLLSVLRPDLYSERFKERNGDLERIRIEQDIASRPEREQLELQILRANAAKATAAAEIAVRLAKDADKEGIGAVVGLAAMLHDPDIDEMVKHEIRAWLERRKAVMFAARDLGAEPPSEKPVA